MLGSLDLHDIVALIDGRPELADELASRLPRAEAFAAAALRKLGEERFSDHLLQASTASYGPVADARAELLRARVDELHTRLHQGPP